MAELSVMLEQMAWENYDKAKTLYHLSSFERGTNFHEKMNSILTHGLRAGDSKVETEAGWQPAIWFFVNKKAAGAIADGLLINDFLLFSIDKRAISRDSIRFDAVAESWATFAFYALREHIPPSYIRLSGVFTVRN